MGTATNLMSARAVAVPPSSTFAELYESHFAAIDLLRRRRVRAETGLDTAPPSAAPETEVLLQERLRRAIGRLGIS